MTAWRSNEISSIGSADELDLASLRLDDTLRNPVTIWVVRHGDDIYVRSVNGRTGSWFRGTQAPTKVASGPAASPKTSHSWTQTTTSTTRSTPRTARSTAGTPQAS